MTKITINKIGEAYWYIPSIVTASRHKWHQRPYKTLKKLLVNEKHLRENLIVRLNTDKDLKIFNALQQIKKFPLTLKNTQLEALNLRQTIKIKIPELKPVLCLDYKSLKALKRGFLPFFGTKFLNQEFKDEKAIIWRKSGFIGFELSKIKKV